MNQVHLIHSSAMDVCVVCHGLRASFSPWGLLVTGPRREYPGGRGGRRGAVLRRGRLEKHKKKIQHLERKMAQLGPQQMVISSDHFADLGDS